MNIVVLGAGYVGCVTAACLAKLGHTATVVDTMVAKVEAIRRGQSPVLEAGLDELIAEQVATGRLRAELDAGPAVREADLAMVCVGTPSLTNGLTDTQALRRVFQTIAAAVSDRSSSLPVVVRSTILAPVLRRMLAEVLPPRGTAKIQPVFNPEFLRETTALEDFFHPPFLVVGGDSQGAMNVVLESTRALKRLVSKSVWKPPPC